MITLRTVVVTVTLLLANGCIPWPHRAFLTPVVEGTLVRNGVPATRTPVCVTAGSADIPCDGPRLATARTDAAGRFVLCPVPDFRFTAFVAGLAHSRFHWKVWAADDGKWRLIHAGSQHTLFDTGPRFIEKLDCDLTRTDAVCISEQVIEFDREDLERVLGEQECRGVATDGTTSS